MRAMGYNCLMKFMKRFLLVVMAVIGLSMSASAISFRSKQILCNGNEQIIFYTNGTYELYNGSQLKYSGEYTIITDESVVRLNIDGITLRLKAGISNGAQKCTYVEFKDPDTGKYTTYHPCR